MVCEGDPHLRAAFALMLGAQYDLVFVSEPAEILPMLGQNVIRQLVWHLDHPPDLLAEGLQRAIRADDPLDASRQIRAAYFNSCIKTLKTICQASPELHILFLASDYELDFQVAALQCGRVNFLPDAWEISQAFVEQLQALLGDKKSSIRHWVVRLPKA